MSSPFCTGCGATVAAGTRFCVKCGQPVGQAAPPPPPPAAFVGQTAPPPPPPPPAPFPPQSAQFAVEPPAKQGAGAGVWIGLLGLLLLMGGAGLWFYTMHIHAAPAVQVAAQPVPAPAPSTTPETPPPNPDLAKPEVPPPNPDFAKPEVPPPNPDFAKKDQVPAPAVDQPVRSSPTVRPKPADSAPASPPPVVTPKPAVKAASPTTGTLHAAVEVQQNGEVVFENLPAGRLRFVFDHSAWQPTIHRQTNGTQTLVMRSLKPGIQRSCDVQWEIVQ
jgi:hypothetical protein